MSPRPTIERLRELLAYDPETGVLTWLVTVSSSAPAGAQAGCVQSDGYRKVQIDGRIYPAHLICFAIYHGRYPAVIVDHDDRNQSNNRIKNLIEATYSDNGRNRASVNATGYRGVQKNNQRWKAMIKLAGGRRLYLGTFDTAEEAARAYDAAVLQHCGPRFPTNASLGLLK